MRVFTLTAILLLFAASTAAQQAAPAKRRSLDSTDLLTRSSVARTHDPIYIPRRDYDVLEPLIRYAQTAEKRFRSAVVDGAAPEEERKYAIADAARKADAINGSFFLIHSFDDLDSATKERVASVYMLSVHTAALASGIRDGQVEKYPKEFAKLKAQYPSDPATTRLDGSSLTEAERLLAGMFRKLAVGLSSFKPLP